jgi:hypothetical protein
MMICGWTFYSTKNDGLGLPPIEEIDGDSDAFAKELVVLDKGIRESRVIC